MAKRTATAIKHTLKICKKTPISIKWKEDPSQENQGLGEAKNGVVEGRDPIENRMTIFQWKIIKVEGKRMRQL
jgi:hypothetical protein